MILNIPFHSSLKMPVIPEVENGSEINKLVQIDGRPRIMHNPEGEIKNRFKVRNNSENLSLVL